MLGKLDAAEDRGMLFGAVFYRVSTCPALVPRGAGRKQSLGRSALRIRSDGNVKPGFLERDELAPIPRVAQRTPEESHPYDGRLRRSGSIASMRSVEAAGVGSDSAVHNGDVVGVACVIHERSAGWLLSEPVTPLSHAR